MGIRASALRVHGRDGDLALPGTVELAEIILEQAEVAMVPGEAFGAPGYMRLSFALSDADLIEGVGRVADLLGGKG